MGTSRNAGEDVAGGGTPPSGPRRGRTGQDGWSRRMADIVSTSDARRPLALIRGAGDLASGVAYHLAKAGFSVAMTEIAAPTVVRRAVAFADAVYEGRTEVEGLRGILAESPEDARRIMRNEAVAVLVDPEAHARFALGPDLLVDAVMAKRNVGTHMSDAPVVLALGPGFVAGRDVHAVIETMRGEALGCVITGGTALPDTGIPAERGGFAEERVLRSPCPGVFLGLRDIGASVRQGEIVGTVQGTPVRARLDGILRGILHSGLAVEKDFKLGDIDPSADPRQCFLISDKAAAIGRAVLEAARDFLGRPPAALWSNEEPGMAASMGAQAGERWPEVISGSRARTRAPTCASPSTTP